MQLTLSHLAGAVILGSIIWRLWTAVNHLRKVPSDVPWTGRTGFASIYGWSQIRSVWNTRSAIHEAYTKFNRHGRPCVVPLPFSRPEIAVPQSWIRWMITQSENKLSPLPVQFEVVGVKYAFLNPSFLGDMAIYNVLKANLSRQLPRLIPSIMEEIASNVDQIWSLSGQFREVPVHEMVKKVVTRVSARLILGAPMCYNEGLLDSMEGFTTCIFPSALFLRLFPPFLHPLLSHVTTYFNRRYKERVRALLEPEIRRRMEEARKVGKIENISPSSPDDVVSWIIADAIRNNEHHYKDLDNVVDRILCRVLVAVFAAIETTSLTMSNALLDLCDAEDPKAMWDALAEEGNSILSRWTQQPLSQKDVNELRLADSALKETLRLRTSIKAVATEVTARDGIKIDSMDVRLPQGSRLCLSSWGIHHDENFYPNASRYDAFRFAQQRQKEDVEKSVMAENTNKNTMVAVNENYLPFGLGRHSCPGRYFAAVELKLFMAYLAVNYDIKAAGKRPDLLTMGHFPIPPINGKILIRRKNVGDDC